MKDRFVCDNIGINEQGHLTFAGMDTVSLAERFGTPLYLFDEERIRQNIRRYREGLSRLYPGKSRVLYASKACSFKEMYRIAAEEGICIDTVSCGEIHTAKEAGFPLAKAFFHGNAKTDEDIAYAISASIGFFVVDNTEELLALEAECAKRNIRQDILLRITPGIDPHTYEAVSTGKVDSKFGNAVETGAAKEITALALSQPHLDLKGFHCHVGSQVFTEGIFEKAAEKMLSFLADMRESLGYTAGMLNLGGGFGVRYVDTDPETDIPAILSSLSSYIIEACERLDLPLPELLIEPGRSIVADAGMTLYRAASVKRIPGFKNYVSVDGGMTDNPRYALYGSAYTVLPADCMEAERPEKFVIAGRCCESGDIIQKDVPLPASVARGSVIAVCTTGAYNYSMASVYNRIPRPAVVFLKKGEARIAVKRETFADLTALDC